MQSLWKLLACPLIILTLAVTSLACRLTNYPTQTAQATPTPVVFGPTPNVKPRIILQRLQVAFLGQDGHRLIGSGCPGNDGAGTIIDYHFIVKGVDTDRHVQRVSVAGDNSTLTWEWPCSDNWGLLAKEISAGQWDIFIAPSLPSEMYTIIFFYDDNTLALGMVRVP